MKIGKNFVNCYNLPNSSNFYYQSVLLYGGYKTLAKRLSSYTVYLACLQSSTRKPQLFQYLKLAFLEIPNVKIWSVFQNQVTYMHTTMYHEHQ